MATKMKLPIIVLCILSIIIAITIGATSCDSKRVSEDWSTIECSIIDTSDFEPESESDESLVYSIKEECYNAAPSELPVIQVVLEENTTKKAKEIVVEEATTQKKYIDEREVLARLLYLESGSAGWDCQVYTCSAILNLSDYTGRSITDLSSDRNVFSVAPRVGDATPTQTQYEVIDYVLSGGRISEVKYFQLYNYHYFGTPVACIDGVYFSK